MSEFLSKETLRNLREGSAVITYGVVWVKVGPDEWSSVSRNRDTAYLTKCAVKVIFDVAEWEYEVGIRKRPTDTAAPGEGSES